MAQEDIKKLGSELVDDVELGKKLVAAYKLKGKAGLIELLPDVIAEAREDYEAVKAALPDIKAGYKTSEFWLTAGVILLNGIYTSISGKVLPIDLNIVLGAVVAIYTTARALVKK